MRHVVSPFTCGGSRGVTQLLREPPVTCRVRVWKREAVATHCKLASLVHALHAGAAKPRCLTVSLRKDETATRRATAVAAPGTERMRERNCERQCAGKPNTNSLAIQRRACSLWVSQTKKQSGFWTQCPPFVGSFAQKDKMQKRLFADEQQEQGETKARARVRGRFFGGD